MKWLGTGLASLFGLAALASTGAGCHSLGKGQLEERLAGLEKNQRTGELERTFFNADLGTGSREFELVYSYTPAREGGGEGRVPVVLVHGTPSTLFTWTEIVHGDELFEGLTANRDVYAVEVVGHGVAPGSAAPYSFERCARFVSGAIRALGLERVHLVGSSYGGEFVWRAALNDPELIASMVLIDSSGYARREGDWLPEEEVMRSNPLAKIGWMLNSRERIHTALEPHFDVVPPDRVEEFFLVCENAANWKAMIDLARDENGERESELTEIKAPTLVVWGENDIAYPLEVYGERFARDIPGAQLVVMPQTGHYPHEQHPAALLRVLRTFYSSVEGQS